MQTKLGSFIEACSNIVVGFCCSMILSAILFWWKGYHVTTRDNFDMTAVFTVVSLARQYVIRRIFNLKERK